MPADGLAPVRILLSRVPFGIAPGAFIASSAAVVFIIGLFAYLLWLTGEN